MITIKTASYIKLGRLMFALRLIESNIPTTDGLLTTNDFHRYNGLSALSMVKDLSFKDNVFSIGAIAVLDVTDSTSSFDLDIFARRRAFDDNVTGDDESVLISACHYADALESMFNVTRIKQALDLTRTVAEFDITNPPAADEEYLEYWERQHRTEISNVTFATSVFGKLSPNTQYASACLHAVGCVKNWTVLKKGEEPALYYFKNTADAIMQLSGNEFEAVSVF